MTRKFSRMIFLLLICFSWLDVEIVRACAVCLGEGELLTGVTVSWIFLVLMPFAVTGSIAYWLVRMYRRDRSRDRDGSVRRSTLTQKESGY